MDNTGCSNNYDDVDVNDDAPVELLGPFRLSGASGRHAASSKNHYTDKKKKKENTIRT